MMYEMVYTHYREQQSKCFQILVEDAADDFQKVQDIINTKVLLQTYKNDSKIIP